MTAPASLAHHGPSARALPVCAACALVIALSGIGTVAFAQSASPREPASIEEWTAITEPLLASIEEEEKKNGPFSPNLVDTLMRLVLT